MLLYIITALISKVVEFHESPTSNQGEPPNPAPSTISTSELTINKDDGFQFCWVKNGTIFLRRSEDSRSLKVRCPDDLSRIIQDEQEALS